MTTYRSIWVNIYIYGLGKLIYSTDTDFGNFICKHSASFPCVDMLHKVDIRRRSDYSWQDYTDLIESVRSHAQCQWHPSQSLPFANSRAAIIIKASRKASPRCQATRKHTKEKRSQRDAHFRSPNFNTLRPRQNGLHSADDIFKRIFVNQNIWILIKMSLKFVPTAAINNIRALVQIMAWRRPDDKPLSEPMMGNLPTHICVTRPPVICFVDFIMLRFYTF